MMLAHKRAACLKVSMISTAKRLGLIYGAPGTEGRGRSRQRWLLVVIMSGSSGCGRARPPPANP